MTLTTHIIIAAAVSKPLMGLHPAFIFLAAVASHYLSDAIPHWDYNIYSIQKNGGPIDPHYIRWPFRTKVFLRDILRFALDVLAGSGIAYVLISPQTPAQFLFLAAAVTGSILPDFLQGIYFTRFFDFLKPVQNFHDFFHTKIKLGPYPFVGVPLQVIIFTLAIYFLI